jgi:hypothetical protein
MADELNPGAHDPAPKAVAKPQHPGVAAPMHDLHGEIVHPLGYELARRSHRVSLVTATFVIVYTTITAVQAFLLYKGYLESQRTFISSERPYVSLGNSSGKIAEFRVSPDGRTALVVYFYNAGRTPALNFIANIWTTQKGIKRTPSRHIERIENPTTGVVETVPGPAIPGLATHLEYAPERWTPSGAEIGAIREGQEFSIGGTYEYCDEFGNYRCEGFWARYEPPPIDAFIQFAAPPCWLPPQSDFTVYPGEKVAVKVLQRCEQPHRNIETDQ